MSLHMAYATPYGVEKFIMKDHGISRNYLVPEPYPIDPEEISDIVFRIR
jgi:hypothetical protein